MENHRVFAALFLISLLSQGQGQEQASNATADVNITTSLGVVLGQVSGGVRVWQGIPYAEAPVGLNRFAAPVVKQPWTTPLSALAPGDACLQAAKAEIPSMNENCLFLNVWAPLEAVAAGSPVMVYIHGGGFASGAGSVYNGTKFAKNGTVVVTINYRLNLLGFLALPEIQAAGAGTGGLNGVLDQISALQWVRDNIKAFGGDPANVTVAGESAGGLSICVLNMSPKAKGLFYRAVMLSGACTGPWGANADATTGMLAGNATMNNGMMVDDLAKLRNLTASDLTDRYNAFLSTGGMAVGPSVDDGVLLTTSDPSNIDLSNAAGGILLGNTNMDALIPFLVPSLPSTAADFLSRTAQYLNSTNLTAAMATSYAELLGATDLTDTDARTAYALMNGDVCLVCPANNLVKQLDTFSKAPVYMYRYDKSPGGTAYGPRKWAWHASDLNYLFGVQNTDALPPFGPWVITDEAFADTFFAFVNSFVQGGPPVANGLQWPRYNQSQKQYMVLNSPAPVIQSGGVRAPQCQLWDQVSFAKRFNFCFQGSVPIPPSPAPPASNSHITTRLLIVGGALLLGIGTFCGCQHMRKTKEEGYLLQDA